MSSDAVPPISTKPDQEPLSMTVYDMPGEQAERKIPNQKTARLKLLIIFLLCAAPVLASYFTYYVIRPDARRNYGELVTPQREMPSLALSKVMAKHQGAPKIDLPALKGQWLLLSVAGGACDADCEKHLYLQRQLRETMNKDKDRWDWVWLVDDQVEVSSKLELALQQATVWRAPHEALVKWLALSQDGAEPDNIHQYLYVIDPMGNYMMRFPKDIEAKKAGRDMERLMRASSSWDKAGR